MFNACEHHERRNYLVNHPMDQISFVSRMRRRNKHLLGHRELSVSFSSFLPSTELVRRMFRFASRFGIWHTCCCWVFCRQNWSFDQMLFYGFSFKPIGKLWRERKNTKENAYELSHTMGKILLNRVIANFDWTGAFCERSAATYPFFLILCVLLTRQLGWYINAALN